MGNLYAPDYNQKPLHMAAAGNAWSEDYSATAAPKNGDKLYLGVIPAGVRVYEVRLKHGAAGASTTAKLGFEPFDGDDPPADDDFWLAASTSMAAAGVERSSASAITFDRPVKLVLTAGGADHASGSYEVVVVGKTVGAP
ncbi:MAG: hypothetical protein J0I30_11290 [Burkholderiales bacterium]|nr:hypothetical protein [Burkholderiales bacterium]